MMPACTLRFALLTLACLVLAGCENTPPPVGWGSARVIRVAPLPATSAFRLTTGEPIDVGYMYKQVHFFFVPVWNYGGRWCGYLETPGHYVALPEERVRAMAADAGITLPARPPLPLWDAVGGKLAFAAITLALIFFFGWGRRRDETQPPRAP